MLNIDHKIHAYCLLSILSAILSKNNPENLLISPAKAQNALFEGQKGFSAISFGVTKGNPWYYGPEIEYIVISLSYHTFKSFLALFVSLYKVSILLKCNIIRFYREIMSVQFDFILQIVVL